MLRAAATVDSVFLDRTHLVDTIDLGDFAAYLLARLGCRIRGLLGLRVGGRGAGPHQGPDARFPADARAELGVIFSFIDSTAPLEAVIAMTQRSHGLMRFRLERVVIKGFAIPDLLLNPALAEYNRRYPVLSAGGREFLVAMPPDATATIVQGGIELRMPRPVRDSVITTE